MDNRWMRRGVAVILIIPARKGSFLDDIFIGLSGPAAGSKHSQ